MEDLGQIDRCASIWNRESTVGPLPNVQFLHQEFIGRCEYQRGLALQAGFAQTIAKATPSAGFILGLEHEPVVTLGKRARLENDILAPQSILQELGIALVTSERGGHATLHSPGQLVIYPVLRLDDYLLSVREYVERLMRTTEVTLFELGILTTRGPDGGPGLYSAGRKIAFFGIRVSRGITSHGVSINVHNDLKLFQLIRSCGRESEHFTSVSELSIEISTEDLFRKWAVHFMNGSA